MCGINNELLLMGPRRSTHISLFRNFGSAVEWTGEHRERNIVSGTAATMMTTANALTRTYYHNKRWARPRHAGPAK
jgi:hypothetical protein